MPQKLKPIEEVIANAAPRARGEPGANRREKVEPQPPPQAPPKEKR